MDTNTKRKQEREQWEKVRNNEESVPSEPEPPPPQQQQRSSGAPTKPLWEQLKAQKEKEESLWIEEEKVLHAPKGLDDDELIFLEEQQDMKAYLREQQQREIEEFAKQVSETVHDTEPSIVDELLKVKQKQQQPQKKKKQQPKLFVKVIPRANKRKTEDISQEDLESSTKRRRNDKDDQNLDFPQKSTTGNKEKSENSKAKIEKSGNIKEILEKKPQADKVMEEGAVIKSDSFCLVDY